MTNPKSEMFDMQRLKFMHSIDKSVNTSQQNDSLAQSINLRFLGIIALSILILSGCSTNPAKSQKDESLITNEQLTDVLFVPGMGMGLWASIMPKKSEAENYRKWEEFNRLFNEKGFNLKVAEIPAMASVDKLSEALRDYIKREFPADQGRKFHIVAKSMGGLAVRKALADTAKNNTHLSNKSLHSQPFQRRIKARRSPIDS